jgi:hypothetical protein
MRQHLAFGARIGYAFNKSDLLFRRHMQEGQPDEVIRAAAGLRVFDPRAEPSDTAGEARHLLASRLAASGRP